MLRFSPNAATTNTARIISRTRRGARYVIDANADQDRENAQRAISPAPSAPTSAKLALG